MQGPDWEELVVNGRTAYFANDRRHELLLSDKGVTMAADADEARRIQSMQVRARVLAVSVAAALEDWGVYAERWPAS